MLFKTIFEKEKIEESAYLVKTHKDNDSQVEISKEGLEKILSFNRKKNSIAADDARKILTEHELVNWDGTIPQEIKDFIPLLLKNGNDMQIVGKRTEHVFFDSQKPRVVTARSYY